MSAGVLGAPPQVHAAACCISATAVGTGRLLNWEDGAVGLLKSASYALGHWDTDGEWKPFEGYGELELKATLWGMARLSRRALVSLSVPATLNHRWTDSMSTWGGFLADVSVGFRYDPLLVGEYEELPAVAIVFGVSAPTGRVPGPDTGKLGEGATGRGAWLLSAGVVLEKTVVPWFVRLETIVNVPLPGAPGPRGADLWFGPGVSGTLSGGYAFDPQTTIALLYRFNWESDQRVDGRVVGDSERLDMGVGLSFSWRFHDHWTVTGSIDTGLFADSAGNNVFGRTTITSGLRYGMF